MTSVTRGANAASNAIRHPMTAPLTGRLSHSRVPLAPDDDDHPAGCSAVGAGKRALMPGTRLTGIAIRSAGRAHHPEPHGHSLRR
jgi:hypothetical protein